MDCSSGPTNDFLPPDTELLQRENIFLTLFDKYNVDEGSNPEFMDEASPVSDDNDSSCSSSSYSEMSGCETEDNYNLEEVHRQLQPAIRDRVNAWPEKGIHFQLARVERGLSVEDWLEANQEFTTTTKKYKKTVITEQDRTTTITTEKTTTTTSRRSVVSMIRNRDGNGAECRANDDIRVASESSSADESTVQTKAKSRKGRTELNNERPQNQNSSFSGLISSKRFPLRKRAQKRSTLDDTNENRNVSRQHKAPPPNKIKRLSPQNMKLRNRKISPSSTASASKGKNSLSKNVSNGETSLESNSVSGKVSTELSNPVSIESPDQAAVGSDDRAENVLESTKQVPDESDLSRKKEAGNCLTSIASTRPLQIVVHSPGAGRHFGTKIDDEFVSVTKKDLKKRVDAKYHPNIDATSFKKWIVPVDQRFVYEPPTDISAERNANDDSGTDDDDLLTSYIRTGHFYRLNSK